jgi:hypothetical protein
MATIGMGSHFAKGKLLVFFCPPRYARFLCPLDFAYVELHVSCFSLKHLCLLPNYSKDMMRNLYAIFLLCATCAVAEAVVGKRQISASPTSSVFSIPTPTSAPGVNSSIYDISQHFCRLWRHASVYADGKIYIDGGNTYVPQGNGTFSTTAPGKYDQGMNGNLIVLDLSQNFTNQDTIPYKAIHKGPSVPNGLIEHALWYSRATRKIYQLGGWFSFNNVDNPAYITDAQLPRSAIWEFDIDAETWVQSSFNLVNPGDKVDRPGAAANCDAPSLNQSFIFEGYVQKRSDYDYRNYTASSQFSCTRFTTTVVSFANQDFI